MIVIYNPGSLLLKFVKFYNIGYCHCDRKTFIVKATVGTITYDRNLRSKRRLALAVSVVLYYGPVATIITIINYYSSIFHFHLSLYYRTFEARYRLHIEMSWRS
jgi:hypothetical protein